jgi:predicted 3-demethylubiquinone-9 3-methyltransferase (glyoxalase superfamily)
MNYYLEILTDNISTLIDSDVGYYHQFNPGDIITIYYTHNELKLIEVEGDNKMTFNLVNPVFYVSHDNLEVKKMAISSLILNKNVIDVTESILREKKINQLGI